MASTRKFNVGDPIVLLIRNNPCAYRVVETTVTKVGRRYAYVSMDGRLAAFDIETGYEATDYSYPAIIFTKDGYEDHLTRTQVIRTLYHSHGIRIDARRKFCTETLVRILNAAEEDPS